MNEDKKNLGVNFINNRNFSLSTSDGLITVMGNISKDEFNKIIRSNFLEVIESLDEVGYKVVKKGK